MPRVYKFGCHQPTENAELVQSQIRLAHRYYNRLIEIERKRRADSRAAQAKYGQVAALEAEVSEKLAALNTIREAIKAKRKAARKGGTTTADREAAAAAKLTLKDALERLKAEKLLVRDAAKVDFEQIAEAAQKEIRLARATCGVYWGTYLITEAAADAARASKLDPEFKRWGREGAVAVQLQKGLPVAELFKDDSRVQIRPVDPSAFTHPSCHERRRRGCTVLRLRVGSDGRQPIWAEWPILLHRPFPEDAVIQWVKLVMRPGCPRPKWSAQFTLDAPSLAQPQRPGMVAVDLGWRNVKEGFRVGYWYGSDGDHDQILLGPSVAARLAKADEIRSIRDQALDVLRANVCEVIDANEVPKVLVEPLKTIDKWRSPAKFTALYYRLKEEGLMPALQELLEPWVQRDRHLWQYETGVRSGALHHRKYAYHVVAKKLSTKYGLVVVEDMDLSEIARHAAPEKGTQAATAPDRNRVVAAPGLLREVLAQGFLSRGGRRIEVPSKNSTRECHLCGRVNKDLHAARQVILTCECGANWDQDYNAARNLLARAQALPEEALAPPPPRKSKWAKRKEAKLAKAADKASAPA